MRERQIESGCTLCTARRTTAAKDKHTKLASTTTNPHPLSTTQHNNNNYVVRCCRYVHKWNVAMRVAGLLSLKLGTVGRDDLRSRLDIRLVQLLVCICVCTGLSHRSATTETCHGVLDGRGFSSRSGRSRVRVYSSIVSRLVWLRLRRPIAVLAPPGARRHPSW